MPKFPGLRRLSSISDYKQKEAVKSLIIEECDDNAEKTKEDNITTNEQDDEIHDQETKEREEKEQFAVKQLREFVLSHPKIINPITDSIFLKKFLYHRKFNIKDAEQTVINYIKARRDHPLCYQNLNIEDEAVLGLIGRGYIFPLSQKDRNGRTVIIFRNEAFSFYKYGNYGTDLFRSIVMTFEHLLCEEENQKKGFVYIVDFAGSCLSEVMKVGVYESQKYVRSGVKSFPIKHASIHWINASAWMRSIFLMMASVAPEKIRKRIHIHSDPNEIFDYIDSSIVPDEYGGQGGPFDVMVKDYIEKLRKNKRYLLSLDEMSYL